MIFLLIFFIITIIILILIYINQFNIKNFILKHKKLILIFLFYILVIFGIFTIIYLIEKLFFNNFKISDKIFKVLADNENYNKDNNEDSNNNFISLKMNEKFSKNNIEEDIPYSFEELLEKDEFLQNKIILNNKFLSCYLTKEGKKLLKSQYDPYLFSLNKNNLNELIKEKDYDKLLDRILTKLLIIELQNLQLKDLEKIKKIK